MYNLNFNEYLDPTGLQKERIINCKSLSYYENGICFITFRTDEFMKIAIKQDDVISSMYIVTLYDIDGSTLFSIPARWNKVELEGNTCRIKDDQGIGYKSRVIEYES